MHYRHRLKGEHFIRIEYITNLFHPIFIQEKYVFTYLSCPGYWILDILSTLKHLPLFIIVQCSLRLTDRVETTTCPSPSTQLLAINFVVELFTSIKVRIANENWFRKAARLFVDVDRYSYSNPKPDDRLPSSRQCYRGSERLSVIIWIPHMTLKNVWYVWYVWLIWWLFMLTFRITPTKLRVQDSSLGQP